MLLRLYSRLEQFILQHSNNFRRFVVRIQRFEKNFSYFNRIENFFRKFTIRCSEYSMSFEFSQKYNRTPLAFQNEVSRIFPHTMVPDNRQEYCLNKISYRADKLTELKAAPTLRMPSSSSRILKEEFKLCLGCISLESLVIPSKKCL